MRALFALALVLAGPACLADAPAPRMTGERLLKKLEPVDAATVSPDPTGKFTQDELASLHTMRHVDFVQGYLAAQLKQNAATLLVEVWRQKWLCPSDRGMPALPAMFSSTQLCQGSLLNSDRNF